MSSFFWICTSIVSFVGFCGQVRTSSGGEIERVEVFRTQIPQCIFAMPVPWFLAFVYLYCVQFPDIDEFFFPPCGSNPPRQRCLGCSRL